MRHDGIVFKVVAGVVVAVDFDGFLRGTGLAFPGESGLGLFGSGLFGGRFLGGSLGFGFLRLSEGAEGFRGIAQDLLGRVPGRNRNFPRRRRRIQPWSRRTWCEMSGGERKTNKETDGGSWRGQSDKRRNGDPDQRVNLWEWDRKKDYAKKKNDTQRSERIGERTPEKMVMEGRGGWRR